MAADISGELFTFRPLSQFMPILILPAIDAKVAGGAISASALPFELKRLQILWPPSGHPNACINCAHFGTDATFLEVHRAELRETESIIAKADANGWVRQSERNVRKRTSLINIVTTLEASHG